MPGHGGVEELEVRVSGGQPCGGEVVVEVEVEELHGEPGYGLGEVPPPLQADRGSLQQPPQPPVFPALEESRC